MQTFRLRFKIGGVKSKLIKDVYKIVSVTMFCPSFCITVSTIKILKSLIKDLLRLYELGYYEVRFV